VFIDESDMRVTAEVVNNWKTRDDLKESEMFEEKLVSCLISCFIKGVS